MVCSVYSLPHLCETAEKNKLLLLRHGLRAPAQLLRPRRRLRALRWGRRLLLRALHRLLGRSALLLVLDGRLVVVVVVVFFFFLFFFLFVLVLVIVLLVLVLVGVGFGILRFAASTKPKRK